MLPYVVYGKRQCKIVKQRHCEAVRHIKLLLPLIAIGEAKAFNQTWNMEWKVASETRLETPLELLLLLSLTFESIVAASSVVVSQRIYLLCLCVRVWVCFYLSQIVSKVRGGHKRTSPRHCEKTQLDSTCCDSWVCYVTVVNELVSRLVGAQCQPINEPEESSTKHATPQPQFP